MAEPVLLTFGSNIDPLANLIRGLTRLHRELGLAAISNIYRTLAVADPSKPAPAVPDPEYLNGAARLAPGAETLEGPELRGLLRNIEIELGRKRGGRRYAPRPLDLDIALMGENILTAGPLILPDPDITVRPFLAVTLAEVAPEARHPLEKTSLARIAARFGSAPPGMMLDREATGRIQAIVGH